MGGSEVGGPDDPAAAAAYFREDLARAPSARESSDSDGSIDAFLPDLTGFTSRTIIAKKVPPSMNDRAVMYHFQRFGELRGFFPQWRSFGFVILSYFDVRCAERAAAYARMNGSFFDCRFCFPLEVEDNQGTVVIFNLDGSVTDDQLRMMCEEFGEIRDVRSTPKKNHQRFLEFFDVRAAQQAILGLNKRDVSGRKIKIELSHPGGSRKALMEEFNSTLTMMLDRGCRKAGASFSSAPSLTPSAAALSLPYPAGPQASSSGGRFAPALRRRKGGFGAEAAVSRPLGMDSSSSSSSVASSRGSSSAESKAGSGGASDGFAVDFGRILSGNDVRTTVMVRNIPNKYDRSMLLEDFNREFQGKFDFLYLPMDFSNDCNMGYAFVNFLVPQSIVDFCQRFDRRRWGRFNSEKVCQITYAKIQGKRALVEHFRNSNVMLQPESYRPIVLDHFGFEEAASLAADEDRRCGSADAAHSGDARLTELGRLPSH